MALMNAMCDMIQFVVVVPVPVPDESSATLASYFMQHILLKFDLCYLAVLDDGNPFKGAFGDKTQCLLGLLVLYSLYFILICGSPITIKIAVATWLL